jgi:hypothetical protein
LFPFPIFKADDDEVLSLVIGNFHEGMLLGDLLNILF